MEINRDIIEKELNNSREKIRYWEKQYRLAYTKNNTFYMKCYSRQINRWQSRFETLRWILSLEGNNNGEDKTHTDGNN